MLPARNEAATVGPIVERIRRELVEQVALVDEVVVVDSGSVDATAEVAAAAGARVVTPVRVLPCHGDVPGKGEALWKSLYATTCDVLVFIDADLREFDAQVVVALLGPIITNPQIGFVKGIYERPLSTTDRVLPAGGGRVTELVARPLLNLYWPELAGFVQPLVGEYAARRELLEQISFASGLRRGDRHAHRPAGGGRARRDGAGRPRPARPPQPERRGAGPDGLPGHPHGPVPARGARQGRPGGVPGHRAHAVPPRRRLATAPPIHDVGVTERLPMLEHPRYRERRARQRRR